MRDDGKGISASVMECRPDSIGVGIGGMRQRVKEFGGELHLENCNPGMQVQVSIPTGNCVSQEVSAAPIVKDNLAPKLAVPEALPSSPATRPARVFA